MLATGLAGCDTQSKDCSSERGVYRQCVIDTTGTGSRTELELYLTPSKSWGSPKDHYQFKGATDVEARFAIVRDAVQTCCQGEIVPVGRGFAKCQEVGDEHLRVRIWVGDPPQE